MPIAAFTAALGSVTNALGKARSYAYDAAGNAIRVTDRDGRERVMAYDALSRRIGEDWMDGPYSIQWAAATPAR